MHVERRGDSALCAAAQLKELRSGIETLHKDVVRLNTLIAKNEDMTKKLAEITFSMEKEFMAELKVRDVPSVTATVCGLVS